MKLRDEALGALGHVAGEGRHALSVGREREAAALAGVERDAERVGEPRELRVQRGLRDVQRAGGAREVAVRGEHRERTEQREVGRVHRAP